VDAYFISIVSFKKKKKSIVEYIIGRRNEELQMLYSPVEIKKEVKD